MQDTPAEVSKEQHRYLSVLLLKVQTIKQRQTKTVVVVKVKEIR